MRRAELLRSSSVVALVSRGDWGTTELSIAGGQSVGACTDAENNNSSEWDNKETMEKIK